MGNKHSHGKSSATTRSTSTGSRPRTKSGSSPQLKFSKQDVTFGSYSESDFPKQGKQLLLTAISGTAELEQTVEDSPQSPSFIETNVKCPSEAKHVRSASTYTMPDAVETSEPEFFRSQLQAIAKRPANATCADCTSNSSTWASITHGVFLCPECVGCHRSLGSHISFTQSTTLDLDSWTLPWLQVMERTGNEAANKVMEYHVPEHYRKPVSGVTPFAKRQEYIRAKYEKRMFTQEQNPPGTLPCPAVPDNCGPSLPKKTLTPQTSYRKARAMFTGMVEFTLISGSNLVPTGTLRISADPYVVFELGDRQAKSSYVRNSLNPVWNEGPNENITMRIPWDGQSVLRVSCWDRESVLKDGLIGRSLVDLSNLKGTLRARVNLYGGKSAPPLEPIRQFLGQAKNTLKTLTTNMNGGHGNEQRKSMSPGAPKHRRSATFSGDGPTAVQKKKSTSRRKSMQIGITGTILFEVTFIDLS